MSEPTRITPKCSLTFKNVDSSLNLSDQSAKSIVTIKRKFNSTTFSLGLTDATARKLTSLKDVAATVDQRFGPKFAVTGNYAFNDKSWKASASWDGTVASKKTTLKSTFSAKNRMLTTEANIIPRPHHKATVTFDQLKATSVKYSLLQGGITYVPAYNIPKKSFSFSATKKTHGNHSYKISYDFKSEQAGFEWQQRPFTITVQAPVSFNKVGKATFGLHLEQEFHV